jgi:alpha-D-xyloside xylohydrolase
VTSTRPGSPCEYLSLSRSGYIGSQRFCSMIWSGDITSTWATLSSQIASGLSAVATGWSWWTLDIGGFQADSTIWWSGDVDEEQYRELYVRWQQWAVFLPFFRNHGTRQCNTQSAFTCDNEPWSYGNEHILTIVGYINLRYQLAPYLKAVFKRFSQTGRMIMRPLYMDFGKTDPSIMEMTRVNANITTQQ